MSITDKIRHLPDDRIIDFWSEQEEAWVSFTTTDLKALVSELEAKTRALERIANWETQYSSVPEDFISIAQAALKNE